MEKQTKLKMPTPKTVEEAIALDSKLEYIPISVLNHKEIVADGEGLVGTQIVIDGSFYDLNEEILIQIRRYTVRETDPPQLILYEGQIVKAVSGLFKRIPLQHIWDETVKVLGEPITENKTSQAIICQFKPISTNYRRGEIGEPLEPVESTDYQVTPTIAFSFNFAERSFLIGFTVGVFFCENQLFVFCNKFSTKIVHNKNHMANFDLATSIQSLVDSVSKFEEHLDRSQKTLIDNATALTIYWKGIKGKVSHLEKVLAQHKKNPAKTLWEALMNITWVTTHQIGNYNISVDLSTEAGNILCNMGKLYPDDYVNALGFYMKQQRLNKDRDWKETNYLMELDLKELQVDTAFKIRVLLHQKIIDESQGKPEISESQAVDEEEEEE